MPSWCSRSTKAWLWGRGPARSAGPPGCPRPVQRAGPAAPGRDEQADAAQPGGEVVGVVRGPEAAVAPRVAPQGARVLAELAQQVLDHLGARDRVALVAGVQQPAVGGGGREHARVAGRVRHRPEPAHGQPGHHPAVAGPPVPLQQLPQLGQVEGLPARGSAMAVLAPVGVEADLPGLGHHHQHLGQRVQVLQVGGAGPALVGVAAAVQQPQHRPAAARLGLEPAGQQQPRHGVAVERRGVDDQVPHPGAGCLGGQHPRRAVDAGGCLRCAGPGAGGAGHQHREQERAPEAESLGPGHRSPTHVPWSRSTSWRRRRPAGSPPARPAVAAAGPAPGPTGAWASPCPRSTAR